MGIIKLKSSDGVEFGVDIEVAKMSGTINQMLESCGIDEESETVIPLPNVDSKTLRIVLEWANHHKDDEEQKSIDYADSKNEKHDDEKVKIPKWDTNFLAANRAGKTRTTK